MQMQILNTAAMENCGRVLTFGDTPPGSPVSMDFYANEPLMRYCARRDLAVDYESGMSLLILYPNEKLLVFYLDRMVQLHPGVSFSIIPLGPSCSVRFYLHYGDSLTAFPQTEVFPAVSAPRLETPQLYTCFYQESARDFYFRGESHSPYELTYVDHGMLHNLVNGSDIVLHQGDLLIIDRDAWHMQYSDGQVNFLTVTFDLPGNALDPVCDRAIPLPTSAREHLKRFLQERGDEDPYAQDSLDALLKLILIELLRSSSAPHTRSAALPSTSRAEHRIVDRALQIIAQRVHRPPSLKELANDIHVSVPYLCRLFTNHLGMPPGEYITKVRLEECKDLLRRGELSIGDISARMGFSSQQHFSRQFKHYCGLTPTEYTRSLR